MCMWNLDISKSPSKEVTIYPLTMFKGAYSPLDTMDYQKMQ